MKIVLVSHSDKRGGAAVVTYRLMEALAGEGADVAMLVSEKLSDDPRVHQLGTPLGRRARFLSERLNIFSHNGFSRRDLFKVSIATRGYDIVSHPLVADADAIILSWINQGTLSLSDISRLGATGKPIAWMMHDMWAMTGICHHAIDCDRYRHACGSCPYIHLPGAHPRDLSAACHRRKMSLYDTIPRLRFVAVSSWLAGCALRSSLLSDRDITIIPNPFPIDDYYTRPRRLMTDRRLIVMGAARLDDPIKDLPTAVASLNALAEERPDIAADTTAIFFGTLRDQHALDSLRFPHRHLGQIADPADLRELYAHAAVVLSTSQFETLPGTIIEGMAAGATPVSFDRGGQRDIIDDGVYGIFAGYGDPRSVARSIARALDHPFDRDAQHSHIATRFGAPSIARRYLDLLSTNH